MATQLKLSIPSDVPGLLKMSNEDFTLEAQMLLAVKLFELGKLTSGKAAEVAGMPRVAFLYSLERYGVAAINLQAEEIDWELSAAHQLSQ